MSEIVAGVCSMASRPPKRISVILIVSSGVRARDDVAHVDLVGERLQGEDHVEVPGVERRVVRLADHAPRRVELGKALGQHRELAEVGHGGVPADAPLPDERRTVDAAEDHVVAADVHRVLGVTRLHVELAWRLGDLLEHELGIEPDRLVVDGLARLAEQLDRFGLDELHADLRHDATPTAVEDLDRVGGKQLVPGHLVDEHRHLVPRGITARLTLLQVHPTLT